MDVIHLLDLCLKEGSSGTPPSMVCVCNCTSLYLLSMYMYWFPQLLVAILCPSHYIVRHACWLDNILSTLSQHSVTRASIPSRAHHPSISRTAQLQGKYPKYFYQACRHKNNDVSKQKSSAFIVCTDYCGVFGISYCDIVVTV